MALSGPGCSTGPPGLAALLSVAQGEKGVVSVLLGQACMLQGPAS